MKKILKTSAIFSVLLVSNLGHAQSNSEIEVSATVDPGCFLEAENVNFGSLIMPITNQSAQSEMKIKCSKNTSLSISIEYGLVTSGSQYSFITVPPQVSYAQDQHQVKIYKDGIALTNDSYDIVCHANPNGFGGSGFRTSNEIIKKFKIPVTIHNAGYWENGTDMCDSNGKFNVTNSFFTTVMGALSGISSGEVIKYSFEKPNSTSNWNNSNSYEILSTGVEQVVPLKAVIKSSENPQYRMTPDHYLDTVTIVLKY